MAEPTVAGPIDKPSTTLAGALVKAAGNGSVPTTTISLVYLRAGQIAGNTYQAIRHSTDLRKAGESEERIGSVGTW